MNKNTKGIIAVAATLGLIGAAYYFLIYRNSDKKNFDDVSDNLGGAKLINSAKDTVMVDFNNGKNQASFFNNNRFSITTKGITGYLKKGTYLDGGKKLIIDEGNTIEGDSVWENLNKAII